MAKEEKMFKACPNCGSKDMDMNAIAMEWDLSASTCRRCQYNGPYIELTEEGAKTLEEKYLKRKRQK